MKVLIADDERLARERLHALLSELDGIEFKTGKQTLGARFQRAYLRAVTGKDESRLGWLTPVSG